MVERKCKGCGGPVKGHKGPMGAGRCPNEPVGSESTENTTLEQTKTVDVEMKNENESMNASANPTAEDTTDTAKEEKKEAKSGKSARGRAKKKPATETTEASVEVIDEEGEVKATNDEKETEVEKNDDTKKTKGSKTARGRAKKKPESEIEENLEKEEVSGMNDDVEKPSDQMIEDTKDDSVKEDSKVDSVKEASKDDYVKEDRKKESKVKAGGKGARGRAKKKEDTEERNEKETEDVDDESNPEKEMDDSVKESDEKDTKAKAAGKSTRGRQKKKPSDDKEDIADDKEDITDDKEDIANEKEDIIDDKVDIIDDKEDIIDDNEDITDLDKEDITDDNEDITDIDKDKEDIIVDKEDITDSTEENDAQIDSNKEEDENKEKNESDMNNDQEESINVDSGKAPAENLVGEEKSDNESSKMQENDEDSTENDKKSSAKGKKKTGKATVKSKEIAKQKALKDITNVSAESVDSTAAEMEGTFVVDKASNNNDDSIEDSENKKKKTKKQQSRRRTFVIDESSVIPDLGESTIGVIQEGEGSDEENAGIPKDIDMDWTLNLSIDKETDWKRQRLYSKSDFSFDVRPYLIGKKFLLCGCNYYDDGDEPFMCDCDAEIHFNKNLTGSVVDVFYNPLDDEEDLKPAFKEEKQSWGPDRPNLLMCEFTKVKNRSITSVQGQIHITGERCVEVEKGRKIRCMFFMAEMDLVINGSKPFLTKLNKTRLHDIGNPIKFRKIKFDMISHEAKLSEDSNQTGMSADESIVSKSADMTGIVSKSADLTETNEEEMEV